MTDNLKRYVNAKGDFEFPNFLHHTFNTLMKATLDLGNLACTDANQLRAFKETVKKNFKQTWYGIAGCLEEYDLISPCTCLENEYCTICGGSRFVSNSIFNSDVMDEAISIVGQGSDKNEIQKKLAEGLVRALKEAKAIGIDV